MFILHIIGLCVTHHLLRHIDTAVGSVILTYTTSYGALFYSQM